ncbi:MAG: flavin reductase family protein [Thaumarchaeota archaeon]|nr:flavin reductase family protein [Nitrososphaerota archaeon]
MTSVQKLPEVAKAKDTSKREIKVYRLFYPQIAVIIASGTKDRVEAVAINSVISGSSHPARVVFAMKKEAAILPIVRERRSFSVNWMDSRFVKSVDFLGFQREGNPKDKIKAAGLTWLPGNTTGTPMVSEAAATLECSLDQVFPLDDSDLVVGRVVSTRASGDFSEYWRFKTYKPLIYFGAAPGKKVGRYVLFPYRR